MPGRQEVERLARELHKNSMCYKQISRELEQRGFLNARGAPFSKDSIKLFLRAARVAEDDADWPLAPG